MLSQTDVDQLSTENSHNVRSTSRSITIINVITDGRRPTVNRNYTRRTFNVKMYNNYKRYHRQT